MAFGWIKNLTFPLRATLVGSVVASAGISIAITVGAIGYPAYRKATQSIRGLWAELAKQVAQTSTEEIVSFFDSAPTTLRFIEGMAFEQGLNVENVEFVLDICYRAMKENPDFAAVYYAGKNGLFYAVYKEKSGFTGTRRTLQESGKTKIENYRIGPDSKWVLAGEELGDYDPRKRPFWATGLLHPEGAWTEPYPFVTLEGTGYSYVLGHKPKTEVEGFWVVDFQIDQLSKFLRSLEVGQRGVVSLLDHNGTIISRSTPRRDPAMDEEIGKVWEQFVKSGGKTGYLNIKGRILYVNRFPEESQIPWNLVTIIHEDDVLGPIRRHALRALAVGLIPCLIFLAGTALYFGRISRRLKEVASEMDDAGNLVFEIRDEPSALSRIKEVNEMNIALRKMKIGLQSFSKYVPFDLVKKVIRSGAFPQLGGEKREISVLFADLVQFTTLAERLSPDEIVAFLSIFLDSVTKEVHQEKGTIDKFMGDAVMGLFGAPDPLPGHASAACRAALAMKNLSSKDPRMKFRIGINSGPAMVGNFGSRERMDYTAIGDMVNIASRMEKINKEYGTQILIGPGTAQAVEKTLLARPIDWAMPAGKTQPLLIFELLCSKEAAPKELVEAVGVYTQALASYRLRKFGESASLFEQANLLFGGSDLPSKILAAKSRAFQKTPPPENWDGTARLISTE